MEFISRLDNDRFTHFKADLKNQKLFGQDRYPKTLIGAKTLAESVVKVHQSPRTGHNIITRVAFVGLSSKKIHWTEEVKRVLILLRVIIIRKRKI